MTADDDREVRDLYDSMLESWNARDAARMAALIEPDGNVVGFDGSQLDGRDAIAAEMSRIFRDHPTGRYVGLVREVRLLNPATAVLRAVAGMIPPGQTELNATLNAVQTLVATKQHGRWRVAVYHNTPAAFHGQPDAAQALTRELRAAAATQSR
jgi:uncharacterized protein (TIGR02246 family)